MSIDFDDIKIIKKLGAGMFGTTYKVKYQNNIYALKIQHILPEDVKKSYKTELWREMDLYNHIDTLNSSDKKYFMRLYGFMIYDNCDHKQVRPVQVELNEKNIRLDNSKICVKYLLEYKGETTLHIYLVKNSDPFKKLSICLQLNHIFDVLYRGEYAHGDVHTNNLMIDKFKQKYFMVDNAKIPTYGNIVSIIDYGTVMHNKFKFKYDKTRLRRFFKYDRDLWMFHEYSGLVLDILRESDKIMYDCIKLNDEPWKKNKNWFADGFRKILSNHSDFVHMTSIKYMSAFCQCKKLLRKIIDNPNDNWRGIISGQKCELLTHNVVVRMIFEFWVFFPEKYSEYFCFPTSYKSIIAYELYHDVLIANNYKDFLDALVKLFHLVV